ncbi:poly [ADP-ribose] polymerase tankyrase-like isoform X2 [Dreissena polymorpha]|uniref:poly [ADP-ribose] polymerase tankyrase-like isoform X2 n=1 Tax=Dreissena polymorpha TaxID=45954 RepID=UPI002263D128|nr:poly [ADP-ribose] polymerase tankyrase-like isoform X2 [Dreissena polymorpha]
MEGEKGRGKKSSPEKETKEINLPNDGGSSAKRKRVDVEPKRVDVEPRTPLKRQRVPVQKFQSPAEELIPMPSTSKQKDVQELIHKKGTFLGVRGEEGSFYLCKTLQNVFDNTRKFRIQWLDLCNPPDVYKIDFPDSTDADCILTNVKMERLEKDMYKLPMKEQTRVEEILHKALKKERGEPVDDIIIHGMSGSEEEEGEEEELEEEEKEEELEEETPKKSKGQAKSRKSATPKSASTKPKTSKGGKKTPAKDTKEKPEKKRGPDKDLKPNPKIKVLEKEPFLETRENVEFVSKKVQGKLAIRAVLLNDMKLLKSLLTDGEKVYNLDGFRSVDVKKNALHYAIEKNNKEAIKILAEDFFGDNERIKNSSKQSVLISKSDTGKYNPMSLGIARVRQISQARGSKEGNDAFVKEEEDIGMDREDYVQASLSLPLTKEGFLTLIDTQPESKDEMMQRAFENIYQAVLCGNRKLAGFLIEEAMNISSSFGFLHKDVLLFDKQDLRANIMAASVKKKPWDNKSITPLHCAAINPNVSYLSRLLSIEPNINLEDRDHRRPIHFSAVCEGVGPLEYLLQRGASPLELDNQGMTPLHYACFAGRPRNVDILVKKSKEVAAKQDESLFSKWGPGGVNRPTRYSYCPVHYAVMYSHVDVLKILIKHQVDVNKCLSAGKNKVTPLMMAAQQGNMEICRVLVQNGAFIDILDKLKRSALTHAVINGHTHVASYLLNLGANPNCSDSSGNKVVHYAAAYGWICCLKLLKEAGASFNVANDWQTTPISIAFLKGHVGIVDFLLSQPGVDINFKDDEGRTLTTVATTSALVPGLYNQVKYLLARKADPTICDVNGMDSLHHLASCSIKKTNVFYYQSEENKEVDEEKMSLTVKIAQLLLDAGCDPTAETADGKTALMLAIEKLNIGLVKLLVDNGATVTSHKSDSGKTILHSMADLCMDADMGSILRILVNKTRHASTKESKSKSKKMIVENGDNGVDEKQDAMEVDSAERTGDKAGEPGDKPDEIEKMEVDKPKENGSGDTENDAVVNGKEKGKKPPRLQKMVSIPAQDVIWQTMATEVDNEGYTPLLWACKVYRKYKKMSQSDEAVKTGSCHGRSFLAALIDVTGADVSATVKEKTFPDEAPAVEKERYTIDGKCSPLHLLLHVGHEVAAELDCAGLKILCKHGPNTEHQNMDNKTPLVIAVEDRNKTALDVLIACGANVNVTYGNTVAGLSTPLHKAVEIGDVSIVESLIKAGADVNAVNTKTGLQPLQVAVHYRGSDGHVIEVVRLLIDAGADVNAGKFSALHSAVLANLGTTNASTELEEYLISRGANVFAKDEKQRLPLHYAFITQSDPESVSRLDPIELCSVLTDAMNNKELDARDEQGRSPLHLAAMRGATISCVHLLQRNVPLLSTDKDGHTALSLAVKYKHDSCAIVLLQKGAKVDSVIVIPAPEQRDLCQYHTMEGGQKLPVWSWLPTKGVHAPDKETVFDIYETALSGELQGVAHMVLDSIGLNGKAVEAALRTNSFHIALRHLNHMKERNAVSSYKNTDKQNLLHTLALHTSGNTQLQLKVAKALVEKGVSMKSQDKYNRYPVVYAALNHQPLELVKYFVDESTGADLNLKDVFGRTLMVALFWDQERMTDCTKAHQDLNLGVLKLLLDQGVSLEVPYSISYPLVPLFDVTMAGVPLDYSAPIEGTKMTPLVATLHSADLEMVRFLLKNGASVNQPDEDGLTPIMHAVRLNEKKLVCILLDFDYKENKGGDAHGSKPSLKKKVSCRVFAVMPAGKTTVDPDDDFPPKIAEDEDEDYPDASDCDNQDVDEDEGDDDAGMAEEGANAELESDSDHDTDVVEDEEEDGEAHHLPIPRLGSKQSSLRKQPTSIVINEDFEKVEKTSNLNLDAQDKAGWSVVHHLVSPLVYGSYDNEELLYILHKAGASITLENKHGDTPLAQAIKSGGTPRLSKRLQDILGIEADKLESTKQSPFKLQTEPPKPGSSFEADSEEMLKKITPAPPENDIKKAVPKVDSNCLASTGGEIVFDQAQGIPYDVVLSKIEIHSFLYDTYNFYKIQIIHHKAKNIFILFTKWGRIGTTGQYQQTPYQKLSDAVASFCQIFKSKTGNKWTNIKEFSKVAKKYHLVAMDRQPQQALRVDFKLESRIPSQLPASVQLLLNEMIDVGMMQAALKKANMAEEYMPFGRIKREILIKARKMLHQIGEYVLEIDKRKSVQTFDKSEYHDFCVKISQLSTDYYSLIPVQGYAYERVEPLRNTATIRQHMRLLNTLLDIETASRIMLAAQHRIHEINPLDYIYRAIGCTVEPLREEEIESQYILKYIESSNKTAKVLCIYRVSRADEDQREKFTKLGNHRLLWHGSATSNFIGILSNGLQVAPSEAPLTGSAFGEGIYTADAFDKCYSYCRNFSQNSSVKCALLCEVALGNIKEDVIVDERVDLIHSEYNSLKIMGQKVPDQAFDVTLPYGAVMPVGCLERQDKWISPKGEVTRYMPYNEYVVQDSEQITLRYLVQFVSD